jgi:hypothetical protein
MRFDYTCTGSSFPTASVLVGLKKVPDHAQTPGLAAFFDNVCPVPGAKSTATNLDFSKILTEFGANFAKSVDSQIISSSHCFKTAAIFTLLNEENHLPIFPVTASDWDRLVRMIPEPFSPAAPTPTGSNPCSPTPAVEPPHYYEYGFAVVDRICLDLPDLVASRKTIAPAHTCCKYCHQSTPEKLTTTLPYVPPPPTEEYCFDCVYDEMLYAILATIIVHRIAKCFFEGICSAEDYYY